MWGKYFAEVWKIVGLRFFHRKNLQVNPMLPFMWFQYEMQFCGNIIELVMKRYTNIQNIWYKRTCEHIPLYLDMLLYTKHYCTLWLTARISSLIWYEIQTKEVWIKWLSQLAKSKMAQLVQSMDKKYTNIFSFLHMFRFLPRWNSEKNTFSR